MVLTERFPLLIMQNLFAPFFTDFVLAFAFFTAAVYAVLGKRFERQRPAITMSATMGLALALGLIWWEQQNDLSIKNLGPVAVGFALCILALVIYQALHQVGGSWAGAAIALGACLLIGSVLGLDWPLDSSIIQTLTFVALLGGILALLAHHKRRPAYLPSERAKLADLRHDMSDLYRDRRLSDRISGNLHRLRRESAVLNTRPEYAQDVMLQLQRMLPAEGYLTERLAQLRSKAYRIRRGHISQLEETQDVFAKLPVSAKKQAAAELSNRYGQLVNMDTRLARLDQAVATYEQRIRDLTRQAQVYAAKQDFQKLTKVLEEAEKLQRHNSKLFQTIERTENRLIAIAQKVVREAREVHRA